MTDNNAYRIPHDNDQVHDKSLLSAGFRVGNIIYISGQVAIDDNRQIAGAGDFPAQVPARSWRSAGSAARTR